MNDDDRAARRRLITLGELIALAALIVSALGVWINWKGLGSDKPAQLIEQRTSIPLILHAKAANDGRTLEISPVETSHALQSLNVVVSGVAPIETGSDGDLGARDVQPLLKARENEPKGRTLTIPVRIEARYVEAGHDRRSADNYTLLYRWGGGGLFGGRSLKLVGLSRG